MEQDAQLHRGLSREVLRYGLLPRLRNLARRFADRSLKLCPSVLCCSPTRGTTTKTPQSNTTMAKVLSESYRSLCLPEFMATEDAPTLIKTLPLVHRPEKMEAGNDWDFGGNEQPSTLARMSSSLTSTDELQYGQPYQTTDGFSSTKQDQVDSSTLDKNWTSSQQVPQITTVSTQSGQPHTSTGTQHELETRELAIQATNETSSMGIQCTHEMASTATQAGPSVQDTQVQAVVNMANCAAQAVVETRNSSVQAVRDTKTQGTQYELEAVTRSPPTEKECHTKDTSTADLREKIVGLVQTLIQNRSVDVEDKVLQFLQTVEDTYKGSPANPQLECQPRKHAAPENAVPSDQEAQNSTASCKSPQPKVQALQQMSGRQGQDSSGSMVEQKCETAIDGKVPGCARSLTVVLFNTENTRENRRDKDDGTEENGSQVTQQTALRLQTSENIAKLRDAVNDVQGLPSSYFYTLEDMTQQCSSGPTTRHHIPHQCINHPGQCILPADELRTQACRASYQQDDPTTTRAQSVILVCGAASGDIWGEIEEAMEGCGEAEVSNLQTEAAKAEEANSPDSYRDIPLDGTYWLTESLSIPWFFLLERGVPDRRDHALYLRGGVKSEGDKDRTTCDFDREKATDISKTCDLAQGPSDSCESGQRDFPQHAAQGPSGKCESGQRDFPQHVAQGPIDSSWSHHRDFPQHVAQGPSDSWESGHRDFPQHVVQGPSDNSKSLQRGFPQHVAQGPSNNSKSHHRDFPQHVAQGPSDNSWSHHRDFPQHVAQGPSDNWESGHTDFPQHVAQGPSDNSKSRHTDFPQQVHQGPSDSWQSRHRDFPQHVVPGPSDNCESRHRGFPQHAICFAAQLNPLLQQGYAEGSARALASPYQQHTGMAQVTEISSWESFSIATKGGNVAPRRHPPETDETEYRLVNVQEVKITEKQASHKRCTDHTTTTSRRGKGLAAKGRAAGGRPVVHFQPRFYQDRLGYQIPDMEVPFVNKDDVEVQLRDDGSKWVLGQGSFGTVEAAFYRPPEGPVVEVAVKKFLRQGRQAVIKEGKMMQFLQNTGVFPKFYGFMDSGEGNQGAIYLVSELFARGTTLGDIIRRPGYCLQPKDWISICIQLAKGLWKIHQMQIIFNDLKENNVLVDVTKHPVVKFIDLGISTFRRGIAYAFTANELRPFRHMAPEVKHGARTSVLSDIWGLGVLFLDIATLCGVSELGNVAGAALAENPQRRMRLDGIISALVAISAGQ